MLVISRKTSERIHIGEDVVITILRTRQGAVQVGIDAPREVPVRRAELVAQCAVARTTPAASMDPVSSEETSNTECTESSPNLTERLLRLARDHDSLVARELRPGELWFAGTIS